MSRLVYVSLVLFLLVCILQTSSLSMAQENTSEPETINITTKDDWSITIIPYLWMLSLDGDVTVRGTKSPISVDFGDILDNLNFAFMGEIKVRKGRIGGYFDSIIGFLETSRQTVQTGGGPLKIKAEVDLLILEGAVFYRLIDSKMGNAALGAKTNMKLDLLAGGRWTFLDLKLDVKDAPNPSGDQDFFDPFVGFTSVFDFPHNINLGTHGDIGGFSVGSDVTWQLWATLGYRFGIFGDDNANALIGYRALSQDYKTGSGDNRFRWDVIIHGPIIGLAIDL